MTKDAIAGLFVGGRATRMGGTPKGLLRAPDGRTIIERWVAMLRGLGVTRVVLVGRHEAYESLGLEALVDEPPGIGPLGGLVALLRHAAGAHALALACDMPFVPSALLGRLLAAPGAPIVAPRRGRHWEPLFARYDTARVFPAAARRATGESHSLQGLLDEVGATELPLTPEEADELRDWDTPDDVVAME